MTDEIAGLIERLRAPRMGGPVELACQLDDLAIEAATQLAALSARVKELENDAMTVAVLTAFKERAEKAEARATRLQQERDEAYERAAKVAVECVEYDPGYYCEGCKSVSYCPEKAATAIRQLSAGPEK